MSVSGRRFEILDCFSYKDMVKNTLVLSSNYQFYKEFL